MHQHQPPVRHRRKRKVAELKAELKRAAEAPTKPKVAETAGNARVVREEMPSTPVENDGTFGV